jgi:hypothetical protein
MQFMAQSMYAAQLGNLPDTQFSPTKEYEGTLKSLSTRNGYGFIDWPWNNKYKQYVHEAKLGKDGKPLKEQRGNVGEPRDVHISADLLPANCKTAGAKLRFTVNFNLKGHPQASSCQAA